MSQLVVPPSRISPVRMAEAILAFLAEHELQRTGSTDSHRKRRLQEPSCPPSQRPRVAAEEGMAAQWLELERSWWANAWPGEPQDVGAALCARFVQMHRHCALDPSRFVRACLDGAAPDEPPLVTSWCLHEAGTVQLSEWCCALRTASECAEWGAACAALHARALAVGTESPHARILGRLLTEMVGISFDGSATPSRNSDAVLDGFLVTPTFLDQLDAPGPSGPPDALDATAVPPLPVDARLLIRCRMLLESARSLPAIDLRAQFARQLVAKMARLRPLPPPRPAAAHLVCDGAQPGGPLLQAMSRAAAALRDVRPLLAAGAPTIAEPAGTRAAAANPTLAACSLSSALQSCAEELEAALGERCARVSAVHTAWWGL